MDPGADVGMGLGMGEGEGGAPDPGVGDVGALGLMGALGLLGIDPGMVSPAPAPADVSLLSDVSTHDIAKAAVKGFSLASKALGMPKGLAPMVSIFANSFMEKGPFDALRSSQDVDVSTANLHKSVQSTMVNQMNPISGPMLGILSGLHATGLVPGMVNPDVNLSPADRVSIHGITGEPGPGFGPAGPTAGMALGEAAVAHGLVPSNDTMDANIGQMTGLHAPASPDPGGLHAAVSDAVMGSFSTGGLVGQGIMGLSMGMDQGNPPGMAPGQGMTGGGEDWSGINAALGMNMARSQIAQWAWMQEQFGPRDEDEKEEREEYADWRRRYEGGMR